MTRWALVIKETPTSLTVRCPWCHGKHGHGNVGPDLGSRVADCPGGGTYTLTRCKELFALEARVRQGVTKHDQMTTEELAERAAVIPETLDDPPPVEKTGKSKAWWGATSREQLRKRLGLEGGEE